jgi:thiamine biosynthesis lipoprotein
MPVTLSPSTFAVVAAAVDAWRWTGGRFDPTVLQAVRAAGYDRTFDDVARVDHRPAAPVPVPGCDGIVLDHGRRSVLLPEGVTIDLGGIGKGFAADLVVRDLLCVGAAGACVNVGGDLAVAGEAPTGDGWVVGVADPRDDAASAADHGETRAVTQVALSAGGVATSSRLRRRWSRAGVEQHHVIDPATGRPAVTAVEAVAVVAGSAAVAEVLATAVLLGAGSDLLAEWHAAALVFGPGGPVGSVGWEAFAA